MKTATTVLTAAVVLALFCQVAVGLAWLRSASFHMPESAEWCEALGCDAR